METDPVHAIESGSGFYFFFCQPFLVGECEFEFIPVEGGAFGTQYRQNLFHFYLSDTGEIVYNLLMFVLQLRFVGQMLPFATAANTEMFAKRNGTFRRIFVEVHCFTFGITVLFTGELDVYYVAGSNKRNKHYFLIYSCNRLTFSGYVCNCYLFQQG